MKSQVLTDGATIERGITQPRRAAVESAVIMTFGRSSSGSSSAGFGPGPAPEHRLDAPYRDGRLDGFGGRGAADGFGMPVAVQLDRAGAAAPVDPAAVAAQATQGAGGPLPHVDVIQRAFGPHDVRGVRAHTDEAASRGAVTLGAHAFATGNDVAFASATPDLHTAAHEAAHVVQQRAGVHLKDGLGESGDAYEQHADAVADAVVRGESTAALLGPVSCSSTWPVIQPRAIQRDAATPEQLATTATTMLHLDDDVRAVIADTTALVREKSRGEAVRAEARAGLAPHAAAAKLTSIIHEAAPHADRIAAARERHQEVMSSPAAQAPLTRERVVADQAAMARALATNLPLANDALNNLALVALELQAASAAVGPAPASIPGLASALARMTSAGRGLDWTLPASPADAMARRHAHEACPMGSNDEQPDTCHLSDGNRADRRGQLRAALQQVGQHFNAACRGEAAKLDKLIADSAAAEEFLISTLVDTLTSAGKALVPLGFFANQLVDQLKNARRAHLKGQADPRLRDAATALQSLEAAVLEALKAAGDSLLHLDDDDLQTLLLVLEQMTTAKFIPAVKSFVERYRAQIAPLGHPGQVEPYRTLSPTHGEEQAVWIRLDETHRRLARVVHAQRDWGAAWAHREVQHHYGFRTWIDDDLQGAAHADAAPIVDATEVEGVPLNQVMMGRRER